MLKFPMLRPKSERIYKGVALYTMEGSAMSSSPACRKLVMSGISQPPKVAPWCYAARRNLGSDNASHWPIISRRILLYTL